MIRYASIIIGGLLLSVGTAVGAGVTPRVGPASESLTIGVTPQVLGPSASATVFGVVAGGRANQVVTVQFKQCGLNPVQFRDVHEAPTASNGSYSVETWRVPPVNGIYRAVAGERVSAEVPVKAQPLVSLRRLSGAFWSVRVTAAVQFYKKRVLIQRLNARLGTWATIKTVVLVKQFGGGSFVHTSAEFRASEPRGTPVRAVFPASQASPCYLAGSSRIVRG